MLTWKAEADTASKAATTTVNVNDLCRTAETFRGKSNVYDMQPIRVAKKHNSEGCTHHIAVWARKQCREKSAAVSFVERSETAAVNKASQYPQRILLRLQNAYSCLRRHDKRTYACAGAELCTTSLISELDLPERHTPCLYVTQPHCNAQNECSRKLAGQEGTPAEVSRRSCFELAWIGPRQLERSSHGEKFCIEIRCKVLISSEMHNIVNFRD